MFTCKSYWTWLQINQVINRYWPTIKSGINCLANIEPQWICLMNLNVKVFHLAMISDSTWYHRTLLCHIWLLNLDILQGSFRLCNWLSLRRLVSWINHLPPACWSTFWKLTFKQQLGCRFDIMDSISSFFCILTYAIIYVLIHHIIFRLYLYFLNIVLYFFKYSCTYIFHRRSLYTFYNFAPLWHTKI